MPIYQCRFCSYITSWTFCFDHHILGHQYVPHTDCTTPIQLYKCSVSTCNFQATKINIIKRHLTNASHFENIRVQNNDSSAICMSRLERTNCNACANMRCECKSEKNRSLVVGRPNPHEVEWYEDEMYKYDSKYKISREKHRAVKHSRLPNIDCFECHVCSFRTQWKDALRGHVRIEHSNEWFACRICSFKTKWKGNLKKHVGTTHSDPSDIGLFQCRKCSFRTQWKDALKGHVRMEHAARSKAEWFVCQTCSFKTKWKGNLKIHVSTTHSSDPCDIELFQCQMCSFKTQWKGFLRAHVSRKHLSSINVDWLECQACPYKSKTKSDLNKHVLAKHTDPASVKRFECRMCSCKYKTKNRLKMHVARKHSDLSDTDYERSECQVVYPYRSQKASDLKGGIVIMSDHSNPYDIQWFECR